MIRFLITRWPRLACVALALSIVFLFDAPAFAISTSDVIEMFKYTYGSTKLAYLASMEIVLWNILSKRMVPIGGRGQWIIPIRTRNAGVFRGMREGGALTTRRSQARTAEATFALQEFHGIVNVSWKMLQDARKDEYAMERALDFMDDAFRARVFRLLNADLLGYGRGELGILPAADNQTTVTVRSNPLVDLGMIVDLMDASDDNTLLVDGQEVTAINIQDRAITTGSAAAGTAAGDYWTVADSVDTTNGSQHMLGIGAWISESNPAAVVGNIGGINRGTAGNEYWQASELDNGGTLRPLTEDLLLQGQDLCRERGGKPVTDYMSNLAIIRRYHEYLREDTYFALGQVKEFGDGIGVGRDEGAMDSSENGEGDTPYRFSGTPWRAEPFMDANRIYGFNRNHFWIGHGENEVPRPLSEIFDDMVSYFKPTDNADFEVVSYFQGELVGDNPMASFVVRDVAES